MLDRKRLPVPATLAALLVLMWASSWHAALAGDIRWTNIGPGGGGWITCLACDPRDRDVVYAGCDVGGFYKSTDGGRTWRIHNDGLTADYLERIVVDGTDTNVLYIGGRGGMFKSVNGGRTWEWLRNGFPGPNESRYSAPIGALTMDPSDHLVLYAGTGLPRQRTPGDGLIYKTTDGGQSWTPLDGVAKIEAGVCFFEIVIRPDQPRTLLAATDKGLLRSDDAGDSWRKIGRGLPDSLTDVAISSTRPDVVYVTVWTTPGERPWRGGVYRSTDGGETFTDVSAELPHNVGKPAAAPQLTCNFLKVTTDPRDPDRVYAGASSWVGAGLFRSLDAGTHWERSTRKGEGGNLDVGWITMGGIPGIKCLAVSPRDPRRIFVGTSMLVLRSDDGGDSWTQCFCRQVRPGWWQGNGLETTCISHIAVDPTNSGRVYFGYADVGLLATEDGGGSFQRRVEGIPWHGDLAPVVVDPERPNVLWCGMGKGRRGIGGVAKSEDYGKSWVVVGKPETGLPDATTACLVLDPSGAPGARALYVTSAGNGVYKSTDDGATWKPVNDGLGGRGPLRPSCIVLDPGNTQRVFVGLKRTDGDPVGGIYKSEDGGGSWTKINGATEFPDIYHIAIDPRNPTVMFVAVRRYYDHQSKRQYPGGVYRSDDGGVTWSLVLEDRFGSCVLVSPLSSNVVYAGLTDHPYHDNCKGSGVMKSTDGGRTWHPENEGLTCTQIGTIVCDPQNPAVLYIGTGGNGVFKGRDAALTRE